ncbi:hypothetical protein [Mesorhizobium sp. WSM2239]|uniref:Membrane-associated protein n=2 Tax=unclassified Mesorhizobium TaxID=325217 RepID=A0AAU8D3G4_9HYPH
MAAKQSSKDQIPAYPLWITLPYSLFVAVLTPFYWLRYGPGNFLWFSDIALFAVLIALWTGNRLLYSTMAVGVLPLELAWYIDFFTGGRLLGLAAYMFDPKEPVHMRILSGFHLFMPVLIVFMLIRQGYDRRAFKAQTAFAWGVLLASYWLTRREANINWVHGPGPEAQKVLPPRTYLGLYMVLLPVVVYLPVHLVLKRRFRP